MSTSKKAKQAAIVSRGGTQQQISAMLGDRVKKPRTFTNPATFAPKHKLGEGIRVPRTGADSEVSSRHRNEIHSQKRKWRLSEIVKQERESRERALGPAPSFVFVAPHMDSRRPHLSADGEVSMPSTGCDTGPLQKKIKRSPQSPSCKYETRNTSEKLSVSVPGGDAMIHDKSMLPKSHALLLDVLTGLESAMALLRTRKTSPTVGSIRDIVSQSTHRDFTARVLSQLAHIVPEAVAVLPGYERVTPARRSFDHLILRLDNVDENRPDLGGSNTEKASVLGNSPARLRRALLHKRLLQHVRSHHDAFLRRKAVPVFQGESWHPAFDLDRDVPNLPAPPLYPVRLPPAVTEGRRRTSRERKERVISPGEGTRDPDDRDNDQDAGIPQTLLERVRSREKAKETHIAKADIERNTNRSLLTKLPCTMDTICCVLRGDRRSAMGWSQLLAKVEKVHPKKWSREDLANQMEVITDLGSEWCQKVHLKSTRGGFAFRVIAEDAFTKARSRVAATKTYPRTVMERDQGTFTASDSK